MLALCQTGFSGLTFGYLTCLHASQSHGADDFLRFDHASVVGDGDNLFKAAAEHLAGFEAADLFVKFFKNVALEGRNGRLAVFLVVPDLHANNSCACL